MSTIQPVIVTADQDVLLGFYTKLFGAEEIFRVPAEGPAFYLGLRIGDTDLGLVAKANPGTGAAPRILLSIGVDDVDETLGRVEALGGSVRGGPNDMPGDLRIVMRRSEVDAEWLISPPHASELAFYSQEQVRSGLGPVWSSDHECGAMLRSQSIAPHRCSPAS